MIPLITLLCGIGVGCGMALLILSEVKEHDESGSN